jgi:carboxyl-terminal processing protease
MKSFRKINSQPIIIIFIIMFTSNLLANDEVYYERLKKGWNYMRSAYEQLNMHYVEAVDPYPLIKAGINGMLSKLDPYTVFIDEDGNRKLQIMTKGKYGGLGLEVGIRKGKVVVIAPIEGSPAHKKGIEAGDIITRIDGNNIANWDIEKTSANLRGKIGTEVVLSILKPGESTPYEVQLTRSEITIKDVGYSGFVQQNIAYVALNGFSEKAAAELKNAIIALQKEREIKSLILDLRGNPGGLLTAAVDIVNLFVPKNKLVVYTKGFREEEIRFLTNHQPLLPNIPLIVMVNEGSASASEIVAGALQDLDRAVIVGRPTFGKGLVQKIYNIDNNGNSKLKITTAKYFIPSGRCIQKAEYGDTSVFNRKNFIKEQKESVFYTANKRKMLNQGGIHPDIEAPSDSLNSFLRDMIRSDLFFNFAVKYHRKNTVWQEEKINSDSIYIEFHHYLKEQNYQIDPSSKKQLNRYKAILSQKGYSEDIINLLTKAETLINKEREIIFEQNSEMIKYLLQIELRKKYFDKNTIEKYALQKDRQFNAALELLANRKTYDSILIQKKR